MLTLSGAKPTFTVDEAAGFLGVHRQTLYAAIRRSEIPAVRIGRRILIFRHVLEHMLQSGTDSLAQSGVNPL